MFPKRGGSFPPNHPFVHRVWSHYFHHPFWGCSPYFWKHPDRTLLFLLFFLADFVFFLKFLLKLPLLLGIVDSIDVFKTCFLLDSMDTTSCGDGIFNRNSSAIPELT